MLRVRVLALSASLALCAALSQAGAPDEVAEMFEAGRLDAAHELVTQTLESGADSEIPQALRWLGRIEVARGNYDAAYTAFQQLASDFGSSSAAREASTELALLERLAATGAFDLAETDVAAMVTPESERPTEPAAAAPVAMSPTESPTESTTGPGTEPTTKPGTETQPTLPTEAATAPPAPEATRASSPGLVLVGSVGKPFDSAEEAGLQVADFLEKNGVPTIVEGTASQALRGSDAVVLYLLSRLEEVGAEHLIFVRSRWGFREFVAVEAYSADGSALWRERSSGGTAHRSDEVTELLMDKLYSKLSKRLGGPGLTGKTSKAN